MNNHEAIKRLEEMPEDKFQAFFKGLPMRVQLCVQGGLVDWRECLANWYIRERGDTMKGWYNANMAGKETITRALLKALKNMVREWVEIVGSEEENRTPADTLEKARAAIKAAEGGE